MTKFFKSDYVLKISVLIIFVIFGVVFYDLLTKDQNIKNTINASQAKTSVTILDKNNFEASDPNLEIKSTSREKIMSNMNERQEFERVEKEVQTNIHLYNENLNNPIIKKKIEENTLLLTHDYKNQILKKVKNINSSLHTEKNK